MITPMATAIKKLSSVPTSTYSDFALSPSAKRNRDLAAIKKPMAAYCSNNMKMRVRILSALPMTLPALGKSPVLSS